MVVVYEPPVMSWKTNTQKIAGVIAVFVLVLELAVRMLGLADVPIHHADAITGYIPSASQSGRFLDNSWTINNVSMISTQQYVRDPNSIILAGDSVVFGGNPLDQSERVGEQLNKLVGSNVFSIGAGSWGAKNALAYFLSRKDEIGDPRKIIFVFNSADFSTPSSWRCQSVHPLTRPVSHAFFVFRKYLWRDCEETSPAHVLVKDFDLAKAFDSFLVMYPKTKVALVLYPTRSELKNRSSTAPMIDGLNIRHSDRLEMVDLIQVAAEDTHVWNESFYADSIHPSAAGAKALAKVLWSRAL